MQPYADFDCVLDVNVHCDSCKMRMMEILQSIAGVYSVTIDGEKGKVMVSGEVHPSILMRALSKPGIGKHAELKYAKINHPRARRMTNYHDGNAYNHGSNYYNSIEDPYKYRRPMIPGQSYHGYSQPMDPYYPQRRLNPEYKIPYYGSTYQNSYPLAPAELPAARYVPSYAPMENDQYGEEPLSFCSIM